METNNLEVKIQTAIKRNRTLKPNLNLHNLFKC
jgi:hypothetical protein